MASPTSAPGLLVSKQALAADGTFTDFTVDDEEVISLPKPRKALPTSSSFAEAAGFLTTVHYRSKEGNEVKRVILSQPPAAVTSGGAGYTREHTLSDSFVIGTQSISPIKNGLLGPNMPA